MRRNSGKGEAENNNLDPTLDEHQGRKGPAQTALRDHELDPKSKAPSDSRKGHQ